MRLLGLAVLLITSIPVSAQIVVNTPGDWPADACDAPAPDPCRGNNNGINGDVGDLPGPDGRIPLREAIIAANNTPGGQSIRFGVPPNSTLFLAASLGPLPIMYESNGSLIGARQSIDGSAVSASRPGVAVNGLVIYGNSNRIQGMTFLGFPNIRPAVPVNFGSAGLMVIGHGNTIADVRAGVDIRGTAAITVPNTVGISVWGDHNEVRDNNPSGNLWDGLRIRGNYNTVQKNWIGFNVAHSAIAGNGEGGVLVEGGGHNTIGSTRFGFLSILGIFSSKGNEIAGNARGLRYGGITLENTKFNDVRGNRIGSAFGNGSGVVLRDGASTNTVGGSWTPNVISNNTNQGVYIYGVGTKYNRIENNSIGVDSSGTRDMSNGGTGVTIRLGASENTIYNCTVSSNTTDGVRIYDAGTDLNRIVENRIGTNGAGTSALPNGEEGVTIYGGAKRNFIGTAATRNVISGNNSVGVYVSGNDTKDNVIEGNHIGLDKAGSARLGNAAMGVHLQSGANSTTIRGNVISANARHGISLIGPATADIKIEGNKIGLDAAGAADKANMEHGIKIGAGVKRTTVGGDVPAKRNLIAANKGNGVLLQGTDNKDNTILGNWIGTASGRDRFGNAHGIVIKDDAEHVVIGGSTPAEGNLISANRGKGVWINGGKGHELFNNLIGTNEPGDMELHNIEEGVRVDAESKDLVIGGVNKGNTISGNKLSGIALDHRLMLKAKVQGNRIGTNLAGDAVVPNEEDGIRVRLASATLVGGSAAGEGNLLSGNKKAGARISELSPVTHLEGNIIGLDAGETKALPNEEDGVVVELGARESELGGEGPGQGNVIAGNKGNGILIDGPRVASTLVRGDSIGANRAGAAFGNGKNGVRVQNDAVKTRIGSALGKNNIVANTEDGIQISGAGTKESRIQSNRIGGGGALANKRGIRLENDASATLIGGPDLADGNEIAHNTGAGVEIAGAGAKSNRLQRNSIHDNGGLGIDLGADGDTDVVDVGDVDAGANGRMNSPSLCLSVNQPGNVLGLEGFLDAPNPEKDVVEFFSSPALDPRGFGEGRKYIGSLKPTAAGEIKIPDLAAFGLAPGQALTATATDISSNTSEFSSEIRLDILDQPGAPAAFIPVSLWAAAYTPPPGIAVRNGPPGANFMDTDARLFSVRVIDRARDVNAGAVETINPDLTIGTALGAAVRDAQTVNDAVETGNNTGEFRTRAQLLMADGIDDGSVAQRGGAFFLANDGAGAFPADEAVNDRTHLATFGDSIVTEYRGPRGHFCRRKLPTCDAANPRTLHLVLHTFNEPFTDAGYDHDGLPATPIRGAGNGTFDFTDTNGDGRHSVGERSEPYRDMSAAHAFEVGSRGRIWNPAEINRQIDRAQVMWAQACIQLVVDSTLLHEPGAVLFSGGFFDDYPDDGTGATPTADETIIQTNFRSAVNLNAAPADDVIDIYFTPSFTPGSGATASAYTPAFAAANGVPAYANQCHISQAATAVFAIGHTVAHELGHHLTNQGDAAPGQQFFFPQTATTAGDRVTEYRRISPATETRARDHRHGGLVR